MLHIASHDDAHRWAVRQPKNINYKLAPITETGVRGAFDIEEEPNLTDENLSEVGKDDDVEQGIEDVFRDFADRETELVRTIKQNAAERDHMTEVAAEFEAERDHMT